MCSDQLHARTVLAGGEPLCAAGALNRLSANLHSTYADRRRNLPGRGWLLARFGMRRLLVSLAVINVMRADLAMIKIRIT